MEAYRQAVVNTLQRSLFYIPSFKIYGGVAGLYDYGPPGCAVKANVLSFWRKYFVLEENMLEVDCPCVTLTPEVVLQASGHVDKFTDLMVKDEKTGTCYRADHLLKDFCKDKLEKEAAKNTTEKPAELNHILDDLSPEQLGAKIKEYGITSPDTKNPLSDPYPFNLMFQTSIGPSGASPGYLHAKVSLEFASLRWPRSNILWILETSRIQNLRKLQNWNFLMFPREDQMSDGKEKKMVIGEAVATGIVNNETLGYFIGRVYVFLTELGIDKDKLRFRKHLANEMAHYAADCWDAEIKCSHGWIECVGIADRSTYDLKAHTEKSGAALVAHEKYEKPIQLYKSRNL